MKKVVLAAALVLGGLSTYATSSEVFNTETTQVVQEKMEYKEIAKEKLPQAVQDAFKTDFKGATLEKAYVNEKQEYKLEVSVDGTRSIVYADKDGNWIEKK